MKRKTTASIRTFALGLAAMTAGLGGCVSQTQYDQAVETIRTLEARNAELREQAEGAMATVERQAGQIGSLSDQNQSLQGNIDTLSSDFESTQIDLLRLSEEFQNISFTGAPVDRETDRALRQLAQSSPDLIVYDPELGMVRFASDLTFNSGSVEVKSAARNGLTSLAGVLTGLGSGYDIRVVGHTDNVPISSSRRNHPTNRHLSVHRAIAVSEVLQQAGVPASRLETSGWGEYRPAVQNNASGGTAANRRVEIFLAPSLATSTLVPQANNNEDTSPTPEQERQRPRNYPVK
ncbi:MAG: OmpA family protein [Planctomycetota bacterium]